LRNSWWCGAVWTTRPPPASWRSTRGTASSQPYILIVGFSRAIFAAKGWDYYEHNAFFWAKIGTFVAIGILSVPPTLAFLKWRRTGAPPTDAAVHQARRYLWMELALFPLLPTFAAAMARGYGVF